MPLYLPQRARPSASNADSADFHFATLGKRSSCARNAREAADSRKLTLHLMLQALRGKCIVVECNDDDIQKTFVADDTKVVLSHGESSHLELNYDGWDEDDFKAFQSRFSNNEGGNLQFEVDDNKSHIFRFEEIQEEEDDDQSVS